MRIVLKNSDTFGALASTLCLIHCILTPLLYVLPLWWKGLNLVFLIVSFFAVYGSSKNTSRSFMKPLFWISYISLVFVLFNEEIHFFHLPELVTYFAAINLSFLHIYNRKYCNCNDDECCSQ